jgi:CHAD domain-containing protein
MSPKGNDSVDRKAAVRDGHESRPRAIGPGDPTGLVIREALERGLDRIRANEPGVRQGDVEGVHRLRTTTRRLRSELRLFRGLVDDGWAGGMEAELKWLARGLGEVRDLDVLQVRLRETSGDLSDALAALFATLQGRRDAASQALLAMLDDERYGRLVDVLSEAVDRPDTIMTGSADEPGRSALSSRVADAWRSLKKAARRLDTSAPDEDFHRVRKLAKRALHAAEVMAHILKPGDARAAGRFLRRLTRVKDVLGEHQDAVVACQVIEQIAVERPEDGPFNLASGRLVERQDRASREARHDFFSAWDRLDRKSFRSWLKS